MHSEQFPEPAMEAVPVLRLLLAAFWNFDERCHSYPLCRGSGKTSRLRDAFAVGL